MLPHEPNETSFDWVIIALKTTQNDVLSKLLPRYISPNTKIAVLQNGIGNEEVVAEICPNNSIIYGVTNICATRAIDGSINVSRLGELRLAVFNQCEAGVCESLQQAFADSPIDAAVNIYENGKRLRWEKLLWNIAFNGLCTLCRVPASQLVLNEETEVIIRQVMEEVKAIAHCDHVDIEAKHLDILIDMTKTLGDYNPSMLSDFLADRPLEVDYILQRPLGIAEKYHLDVPLLRYIVGQFSLAPLPEVSIVELVATCQDRLC